MFDENSSINEIEAVLELDNWCQEKYYESHHAVLYHCTKRLRKR